MRRSRAHDCQIKEILYQEPKKPSKNFMPSNFRHIKIIQEKNRQKQEEKANYVERK